MTMQNLLTIEPEMINQPEKKEGGSIQIMISSFDVPERAFTVMDKRGYLGLRFEYLGGSEPTVEQTVKEGNEEVVLVLGKKSGRLHGIYMPMALVKALNNSGQDYTRALVLAEEGVDLYRQSHHANRSRSLEAVQRVLKTYGPQLKPIMREAIAAG